MAGGSISEESVPQDGATEADLPNSTNQPEANPANDAHPETEPEIDPSSFVPPTMPEMTSNSPIVGDVILQVHIANIFLTFCQKYARLCDRRMRRFLEFIVLLKAVGAVFALIYAHVGYPLSSTCLNPLKGKIPVESVLRVDIGNRDSEYITPYLYHKNEECPLDPEYDIKDDPGSNLTSRVITIPKQYIRDIEPSGNYFSQSSQTQFSTIIQAFMFDFGIEFIDSYRFEFSHEFGYLRLSEKARKTRKVEVINVVLDPSKDACFGSKIGKVLLYEWFGYEWVILDSIVQVSGNAGYVRNTMTGEQFTVRNGTNKKRMIYIPLLACAIFTALIAMLLRFAYKQVFMFVFRVLTSGPIDFWTLHQNFPYGAVASAVLALIGLEDIMSEYFGDSRIAFYIILNVWIADQFHSYCCHTPITKKYWIRFFYLYHFAFYSYYHIYQRRNAFMALFASCLLTMHMMLYFFHHFELPFVLNTFQIRTQIRNNQILNPPMMNDVVNQIINQREATPINQEVAGSEPSPETGNRAVEDYEVELHISDMEQEIDEILNTDIVL